MNTPARILMCQWHTLTRPAGVAINVLVLVGSLSFWGCNLGETGGEASGRAVDAAFEGTWTETDDNKSVKVLMSRSHHVVAQQGKFRIETAETKPHPIAMLRVFDGRTLYEKVDGPGGVPMEEIPKAHLLSALKFWEAPPLKGYSRIDPNVTVVGRPAELYELTQGTNVRVTARISLDKATGIVLKSVAETYDKHGFLVDTHTFECQTIKFDSVNESAFDRPE